ncbi:MAG: tRNA (N(6)-L-threonylcarbamoyladenosine(37)-C(2))-methylthiotransferase MtaB [Thermodesulfobacteriota bacterium]|nr:tRNA (N(6)-L-threonylcarbamoyladenosine(37)-C(2))-methylthiotransferase MtaB [Thermodesulfobacteriota bacterium]
MQNYSIKTLGCKVNHCESESIIQLLKESGWTSVPLGEDAGFCIINTCTVTRKAAMQSRQAVRLAIRSNPRARIIVTGCYAQTEPDDIKKIKGVHYIIGHAGKHKIPEIITSTEEKDFVFPVTIYNDIINEKTFKQMPVALGERTRPFLKIQDGCNAFCSYCIVPYARGRSRSMPLENILDNIIRIKKSGYREVVLSGIHLGRYGLDLSPQTNLTELIKHINKSRAIERVRLSSIEPLELTEAIIKTVAESDIFCRHFHIPLQSGDDLILKKMRRPYTRSMFRKLLYRIHELIPDAAIGVDTIIGFPGETEEAFENTYNLIEELPATYLHVFPFSSRKGTPASSFPDKVPSKIIKERCKIMRDLGNIKKKKFYKKNIGKKVEVLIEAKRDKATGFLKGMTLNYLPIFLSGNDDLKNTIVDAEIEKINNDNSLFGTI